MVRTGGPGRSKETFDEVARKIEGIWEDVVVNTDGGEKGRKLHFIVFTTILAAVENGVVIPGVSLHFHVFRLWFWMVCWMDSC